MFRWCRHRIVVVISTDSRSAKRIHSRPESITQIRCLEGIPPTLVGASIKQLDVQVKGNV
jgi:hypothetical protein